jgi:predicted HD phosphohydrolase
MTGPASVDELLALLARGAGVYDEPEVDGLAHALQCGTNLLASHPRDPELAVAGLVHDVADIAFPDEHADHASRGAELVEPLLGARVAHLVGAHVDAKRYLVATDSTYRAQLSPRSIETLHLQGEALGAPAVAALSSDRDLAAILALRRADESAKDPHTRPPALATWRSLLEQVAR